MTTEQHAREVLAPAQIAAGLTKAQRALLMQDNPWSYEGYRPGALLEQRGLLIRTKVDLGTAVNHTPAGLSVRQHLLEQEEGRR